MKVVAPLFVVIASLFVSLSSADLPGNWPPVDKPPPPKAAWTSLVDLTKVAKAPIVKTVGNCPAKDEFCNWSCTQCTRNDSDITQCPTKGDWGLSFDDGPTEFTTGLLDFMDKSPDVKVTFFVVGSRVIENPEILQRAVKSGHQVAIHTWSHPALTTQSNEQIIAELKWTELAIKTATGLTPKYMRPPFGDYDDRVRNIATQLGYKIVIWDEDTNDWMSADDKTFQLNWIEGNFTQWVKEPATTGHISLEHDLYKQTAERAQLAIPIVKNGGFTIKPVATCVGDTQPYLENVSLDAPPAANAPPASDPPADPAATAAAPAPAPASTSAPYPYLVGNQYDTAPAASSSPSPTAMPSSASLNSINLFSFAALIVGSFIFI